MEILHSLFLSLSDCRGDLELSLESTGLKDLHKISYKSSNLAPLIGWFWNLPGNWRANKVSGLVRELWLHTCP